MLKKEAYIMINEARIAHLDTWKSYHQNKDQKARQDLTTTYLKIVKYVAGRMAIALPHYIEFGDLISAGNIGLLQAIDNFDYQRGLKFTTYAIPKIRGNILDELRNQDWFPRSVRRKSKHFEKAQNILSIQLSRSANDDELAQYLDINLIELEDMKACHHLGQMISIDADNSEDESGDSVTLADYLVAKNEDPVKLIIQKEHLSLIHSRIPELPEQEQQILILYYYEELSLKKIGEVFNVSESRISQIHTQAIARLKTKVHRRLFPKIFDSQAPVFNSSPNKKVVTLKGKIVTQKKIQANAKTQDITTHAQLISLFSRIDNPEQLVNNLFKSLKVKELKGLYNLLTLTDILRADKHCPQFEKTDEGLKTSFIIESS